MEVLLVIVPFALLISAIFLAFFLFSVKSGQFDDLDTPSHKMLIDDDIKYKETKE